jgi:hypothetical protein
MDDVLSRFLPKPKREIHHSPSKIVTEFDTWYRNITPDIPLEELQRKKNEWDTIRESIEG